MKGTKEKLQVLKEAIIGAAVQYKAWGELQEQNFDSRSAELQKRIDLLQSEELPRLLGKLIAELELQSKFIAMGLHVRSFRNAEQVFKYLIPLMEERMIHLGTIDSWKLIDDIIWLCNAAIDILTTD